MRLLRFALFPMSQYTSNLCHHVEKPVGFHLDANINQLAEIKRHIACHLVLVDVSCEVHRGDLHLRTGPPAHLVTRIPVLVVKLRSPLARFWPADCCISVGLSDEKPLSLNYAFIKIRFDCVNKILNVFDTEGQRIHYLANSRSQGVVQLSFE